MTHVATLIVDPATPLLECRHLCRAAETLPKPAAPRWLAKGVAADLPFVPPPGEDLRTYAASLRRTLAPSPIDVGVQATAGRRKRLLVADMDSTLIEQECIDELADVLGLRDRVADLTKRAMRGEVAFEPALRARVALLRGLHLDEACRILRQRITIMPGAHALVDTMRANGAVTVIVSGGFVAFAAMVAERLGIDAHHANRLVTDGGVLTGCVDDPILGRDAKARILREYRAISDLAPETTMAAGDGANDIAMLEAAGLGVAFRAKPAVAEAAGARIDHGDLTALLYLQGYEHADIVERSS